MPFTSRELSILAYANGFTLWHYRTPDPLDSVLASGGGYFAAADELLRPGDQILLTLLGDIGVSGANLVVAAIRPGISVEVRPAAGSPGTSSVEPPGGERETVAEITRAAAC